MGEKKLHTSHDYIGQGSEFLLLNELEEISNMRTTDDKILAIFSIIRGSHKWTGKTSHKLFEIISKIAKTWKDREDSISFDNLCNAIQRMNLPEYYQEKTEELIRETRTRALSLVSSGGKVYSLGGRGYRS